MSGSVCEVRTTGAICRLLLSSASDAADPTACLVVSCCSPFACTASFGFCFCFSVSGVVIFTRRSGLRGGAANRADGESCFVSLSPFPRFLFLLSLSD